MSRPASLSFFLFYLLFCLTACQSSPKQEGSLSQFSGEAMTMQYKISIGQPLTQAQRTEIAQLIENTFTEIDLTCNKWNPHSELSRLNQMRAGSRVLLSPLLYQLFLATDQIVQLSQGRFDPTIEPLQLLWKSRLQTGEIPTSAEIAAIAPAIGWTHIHFDKALFYKDHDATSLDFGGIAKGLCIDLLCARLQALHYADHYVEWGGEIRTSGQHPEQRPWRVYISRLGDEDPAHALEIISLSDQAVATSGDYLQNWSVRNEVGVTTYFHIFNPQTLQPLEASYHSIASATVVARSCAFADGLATTAMLFPTLAEAQAWAAEIRKAHPEVAIYLFTRSDLLTLRRDLCRPYRPRPPFANAHSDLGCNIALLRSFEQVLRPKGGTYVVLTGLNDFSN